MDGSWFSSILNDVLGKAILGILSFVALAFLGRAQGWWGRASKRGRASAALAAMIIAVIGAVFAYVAFLHPVPPASGKRFAILVAKLDGDADGSQSRHVLNSLDAQFSAPEQKRAIEVLSWPQTLTLDAGDREAAIQGAEKRGREWLKRERADVLVWGEVGSRDKLLRLRFLTPENSSGEKAENFSLSQELELPADFGADLGTALAVQAASAIQPIYERSGEALAAIIAPVVAKLKPLAEHPPGSFSDNDKAWLWFAYAGGEYVLGEERGDNNRLQNAVRFYRQTLTILTHERAPLDWATTQNNLGTALQAFGERESGTGRLDEAVAAKLGC
jgi:hypothetical protein